MYINVYIYKYIYILYIYTIYIYYIYMYILYVYNICYIFNIYNNILIYTFRSVPQAPATQGDSRADP